MGEGYLLALSLAEHPVKNSSLLRGVTSFTYEGLHPGTLYTFEVSTVAGPYTSSPRCISNWTCECHSPGFPLDPALPPDVTPQATDSTRLLQLHPITGQKAQEEAEVLLDVSVPALFANHQAQGAAEPSARLLLLLSPPSCGTAQAATALSHPLHHPPPPPAPEQFFSLCQFEVCWPSPCRTGVWVSAGVTVVKAPGCRFSQGRGSCPSTSGVALLPGDSRPFLF